MLSALMMLKRSLSTLLFPISLEAAITVKPSRIIFAFGSRHKCLIVISIIY